MISSSSKSHVFSIASVETTPCFCQLLFSQARKVKFDVLINTSRILVESSCT
jgi:hypothetical protein